MIWATWPRPAMPTRNVTTDAPPSSAGGLVKSRSSRAHARDRLLDGVGEFPDVPRHECRRERDLDTELVLYGSDHPHRHDRVDPERTEIIALEDGDSQQAGQDCTQVSGNGITVQRRTLLTPGVLERIREPRPVNLAERRHWQFGDNQNPLRNHADRNRRGEVQPQVLGSYVGIRHQ